MRARRQRWTRGLVPACVLSACVGALWPAGPGPGGADLPYRLDGRFRFLMHDVPAGSLLALPDGGLMSIRSFDGGLVRTSRDEGRTWTLVGRIYEGPGPGRLVKPTAMPRAETELVVRTRTGAIILLYRDFESGAWRWDDARREAVEARRDVWSVRSLDGGRTWIDRQRIFEGYCGALMSILETRDGRVVAPIQRYLPDPGRHATCTYASDDDGRTWSRSNIIDLGDNGHHGGGYEATIAELGDGRLFMLLRTNLDRFWEAFSEDRGRAWRVIRPSTVDASSAPGYLERLASGRLLLVWNRLYPQGRTSYERRSGQGSLYPASRHREELSVALSSDDGRSWSEPQVFARGERLCYPQAWERRPGEVWISFVAGKSWEINLVGAREADLARP